MLGSTKHKHTAKRTRRGGGVAEARDSVSGVHLLDLPSEVLEMIITRLDTYTEISRMRTVCKRFNQVSINLLRAGMKDILIHLESHLHSTVAFYHVYQQQHHLCENYDGFLLKYSHCVQQLQSLTSQFRLLKASAWTFLSASICNYFDGNLFDTYREITARITLKYNRGTMVEPACYRKMAECRKQTAKYMRKLNRRINKYLDNVNNDLVLGAELSAVRFLEVLECCEDTIMTSSPLMHHKVCGAGNDDGYSRIQVKYTLPDCWFGMMIKDTVNSFGNGKVLREMIRAIQEIIWISNYEYYSWMLIRRLCDILHISGFLEQPRENAILLRSSRKRCKNQLELNITDHVGGNVFYFGHRSRLCCPQLKTGNDPKREFLFEDRTVLLPHLTDDVRLDIDIDVTCKREFVPTSITSRAIDKDMGGCYANEKSFSLVVCLTSYELVSRSYRFTTRANNHTNKIKNDVTELRLHSDNDEGCSIEMKN